MSISKEERSKCDTPPKNVASVVHASSEQHECVGIGNGAAFKKGREFAAWLGIVLCEYTVAGKQKLLGISKRGNSYLRRLFVQRARAVLQQSTKRRRGCPSEYSSWHGSESKNIS